MLVATGAECVGKITFPTDLPWTLGNRTEDESYCRWEVQVPVHALGGQAKITVKIEKQDEDLTLESAFEVKGPPPPAAAAAAASPAPVSAAAPAPPATPAGTPTP